MIGLLFAPSLVIAAVSYTNTLMPELLQDEAYFKIPFENVGTVSGQIIFYATLSSTLIVPLIGYVYDIIGRFWVLLPAIFLVTI